MAFYIFWKKDRFGGFEKVRLTEKDETFTEREKFRRQIIQYRGKVGCYSKL